MLRNKFRKSMYDYRWQVEIFSPEHDLVIISGWKGIPETFIVKLDTDYRTSMRTRLRQAFR